ncbi:hypothetical protein [Archangium lipolyticum]|uniref:hypothetical protein n=1 Tax=Archangium lipolyticum TaxID=2970465 RepID=UPI00214A60E9|nr:hypothetical protein [Archangium lipolyticum]
MKLRWNVLGAVLLGLGLVGCGSTVGDACTTDNDCGDMGFCITNRDYTPGGYCSQSCVPGKDDTCPSGSTCVSEGASNDVSACFLKCETQADCRTGYRCVGGFKNNPISICVAAD